MTREEMEALLAMEPGRELDKLIATKVMGWKMYHYDKDVEERCYYMLIDDELDPVAEWEGYNLRHGERNTEEEAWNDNHRFSTDISAAWEVVEKLKGQFELSVYTDNNGKWAAEVNFYVIDDCDTAPEAICKAALLSVMDKEAEA